MNQPLVSVIMSTYNETEYYLRQAIESVLNQTYRNIEFIIVLDNPQNSTILNILNEYEVKDTRIKIIINDTNLGLAQSLNRGIQVANGKYVARMDADDISVIDRFEKQVLYLEKNEKCDVVSSDKIDIDECGNIQASNYKVVKEFNKIKSILPYCSIIIHPSVLIRKKVLTAVNGYRNFEAAQDYDLWLRLITAEYEINILPEKLIYYRIRSNSITMGNTFKQYLFSRYAKQLFIQRKKNGTDEFSDDNLRKYLDKNGYYNPEVHERFNEAHKYLFSGIKLLKVGKKPQGLILIFKAFIMHKEIIKVFYSATIFKLKLKNV